MAALPTRQQIDAAEPLDFEPAQRARRDLTMKITATMNGYPVELSFTGTVDQLPAITKRLQELGAAPPPARSFGGFQRPDNRVMPEYNGDGDPCCPVHHKPLKQREWEGRTFWSCPAKAQDGEKANKNGYCDLRFKL